LAGAPNIGYAVGRPAPGTDRRPKFPFTHHRLALFFYLIVIVFASLYLIIFVWTPVPGSFSIEKTTAPANITKETTTSQNSTAKVIKTDSFRLFENGTKQFINSSQRAVSNITGTGFALLSTNPEVRLVSISALFGLLGGSVSGIVSVLTRRLWDTGEHGRVRRLLYVYYARPWVAMSVGLVTYVTLRAGLINMGSLSGVTIISEYGVAAISALVGFMTDEIITRLRDIFRTLFGITSLQKEQELQLSLQKSSIVVNEQIAISATLFELKSTQDLVAHFFIQDTNIIGFVPPAKTYEKFSRAGIATVTIQGNAPGKTYITVMVLGDLNLYDTEEIQVT
jgi:hypothetical protein